MMTEKCFFCGKEVTDLEIKHGEAIKTIDGLYAHHDCISGLGDGTVMKEQTQHILGAADSAHQGIELARSLLQESLGNMGEILTQGCEELGAAPLGSAMCLGQKLKEFSFLLGDLLKEAHGLCVLLGRDLGIKDMSGPLGDDLEDGFPACDDLNRVLVDLYERELEPGKDEFDADEQPF